MNCPGQVSVEEVAILKVHRVILTVFTLLTYFLHFLRLNIRRLTRAKHGKKYFVGWSDRLGFGGNEVGSTTLPWISEYLRRSRSYFFLMRSSSSSTSTT